METPLFRGVRCSDHKLVYGNYVKSDKSWSGKQYHRDWIVGNAQTNGGWFALMGKWAVVDGTVQQYSGKARQERCADIRRRHSSHLGK